MNKAKKILVVDDDQDHQQLIKRLLNKLGKFEVITADDGDTGMELIETNQKQLILVITDIMHSGIDGTELIDIVKRKYPQIRILVCTGLQPLPADINTMADGILYKPYKPDQLTKYLKILLL